MRGNWIEATSSTGGTSALTLSDVTGSPNFDDVFGATGARFVECSIVEFTDSTRTQVSKAESGVYSVALSTMVLTRTKINSTWSAGGAYDNTNPSAISFGTTAANIRIYCGALAESFLSFPFAAPTAVGDSLGRYPMFVSGPSSTVSPANQTVTYSLAYFSDRQQILNCSARCIGGYTGGTSSVKVAVYEIDSAGMPGKRLIDFGNLGALAASTTLTSADLGTPVTLAPGWYYVAVLAEFSGGSGTPNVRASFNNVMSLAFSGSAGFVHILTVAGQTSLDDPATLTSVAGATTGFASVAFDSA